MGVTKASKIKLNICRLISLHCPLEKGTGSLVIATELPADSNHCVDAQANLSLHCEHVSGDTISHADDLNVIKRNFVHVRPAKMQIRFEQSYQNLH